MWGESLIFIMTLPRHELPHQEYYYQLLFQEYSHDMYSYLGNSYANALTYVS